MYPFRVKTIRFAHGERYPLLLDTNTGKPLLMPTVYITSSRRSANLAVKSLEVELRSIMHLYAWAMIEGVDIEVRFSQGCFFELHEIDAIARAAHYKYNHLLDVLHIEPTIASTAVGEPIENVRKLAPQRPDGIQGATVATRIRHIRDYLDWLGAMSLVRSSTTSESYRNMQNARERMKAAFSARLPKGRGRNQVQLRESIDNSVVNQILAALHPDSPGNPFNDYGSRVRNQLIFLLLYTTGIRRGECLGIKVEDIDFQSNTLLIRRRADDPKDPRKDQPNAKTKDRKLPVETAVIESLQNYIINVRRRLPVAKQHTFLFVTHKAGNYTGMPLSHPGYSKIFATLRKKIPNIPQNLSGHTLRHVWNENFSQLMDASGTTEDREKQLRNYLMGWSDRSNMAAHYARRHIMQKANEASLNLQRVVTRDINNGSE